MTKLESNIFYILLIKISQEYILVDYYLDKV